MHAYLSCRLACCSNSEKASSAADGTGTCRKWSWRVAAGQNTAFDKFACQYQLFYRARGTAMWYDPVFKVRRLDGQEVWRRRHYRVRRDAVPGAFKFSVLDNGVVSNENW